MPADRRRDRQKKHEALQKYLFVVGVSLASLEEELNRAAEQEEDLELKQVFYAQGSGFVAILERQSEVESESEDEGPKVASRDIR
jgi:hypothetical protein